MATEKKVTPVKAEAKPVAKAIAKPVAKPAAVKEEVKTEVKAAPVAVKEEKPAVKAVAAPAAKAPAKETKAPAAAKAPAKETKAPAKKAPAKKAPAKKPAAKKAAVKTDVKVSMNVQFGGKSYTTDDLVKIAKDVWKYDLKQKAADFKSVELYVKPEDGMAYYVINGKEAGSFYI